MAVQDVGFILPSVGKSPFRGNAYEIKFPEASEVWRQESGIFDLNSCMRLC